MMLFTLCLTFALLPPFYAKSLELGQNIEPAFEEYMVKAGFLERFTRFVTWPKKKDIDDPSFPFILGIIGSSLVKKEFEKYFQNQTIKNKKVEIREIINLHNITGCHLIFISRSAKSKLSVLLDHVKGKPILTIGDTEGYAQKGVHINFYIRHDGKMRYELNETALCNSGFDISFHLKTMAKIIDPLKVRNLP